MAYTLFVGIDNFAVPTAIDRVERELRAEGIHGATIWPATGMWHGLAENCLCVYVSSTRREYVLGAIARLCHAFGQEEIALREDQEIQCISAKNAQTASGG